MVLVWYSFLLLGALAALSLAVLAVKNHPTLNLVIIAISIVLLSEFPNSFNIASIGGTNISFMDVFSIILLICYCLSIHRARSTLPAVAMVLFALFLVLSIAVGILSNGLGLAINESRQFVWMIVCMLWSTSLEWKDPVFRRRVLQLLVLLGWILVVAAGIRAGTYGFGAYGDDYVDASGQVSDRRILVSGQALVLLFSLMAGWSLSREHLASRGWITSAVVFAGVLALSQQRTVWAVTVAVIVAAVLIDRDRRVRDFIAVGAGLLMLLILGMSGLLDSLMGILVGAAQDTRTYDGRNDGWISLINQAIRSGPQVVAFGEPFGFGYERVEVGRLVAYSPHNWYLTIFLRLGLVGLTIYVLAIVACLVGLLRSKESTFLVLIVVALSIYSWTYSTPWYAAVLLGGALSVCSNVQLADTNGVRLRSVPGAIN